MAEADDLEYLLTEKNKQMLHLNGFLYWHDRDKRNSFGEVRSYWKCVFCYVGPNGEQESKCKGTVSVFNNVEKVSFFCEFIITISHNISSCLG